MFAAVKFHPMTDAGNGANNSSHSATREEVASPSTLSPRPGLTALQNRLKERAIEGAAICERYIALVDTVPCQRTLQHLFPFEKFCKELIYLVAAKTALNNIGRGFSTTQLIDRMEREIPSIGPAAKREFEALQAEFKIDIVPEVFPNDSLPEPQSSILQTLRTKRTDYISAQRILLSCALAIGLKTDPTTESLPDIQALLPVAAALNLTLDQFKKAALEVGAFGVPSSWKK